MNEYSLIKGFRCGISHKPANR